MKIRTRGRLVLRFPNAITLCIFSHRREHCRNSGEFLAWFSNRLSVGNLDVIDALPVCKGDVAYALAIEKGRNRIEISPYREKTMLFHIDGHTCHRGRC